MADWLTEHVAAKGAAPERTTYNVAHWLRFFDMERRTGKLTGGPYVIGVKKALVDRFIGWRREEGVGEGTISRDLVALRSPLDWA